MKKLICFLLVLFFHCLLSAQIRNTDSLRDLIFTAKTDTARVNALYDISDYFDTYLFNLDSALFYSRQGLELSQKIDYKKGEIIGLLNISTFQQLSGRMDTANYLAYKSLTICEKFSSENVELQMNSFTRLGRIYSNSNPDSAIYYYTKALKLAQNIRLPLREAYSLQGLAFENLFMGNYPRALKLSIQALQIGEKIKNDFLIATSYNLLGHVYYFLNDSRGAIHYYDTAESIREKMKTIDTVRLATAFYFFKGRSYLKLNLLDSALLFINRSYAMSIKTYENILLSRTFNLLGIIYEKMDKDSTAISYFRQGILFSLGHGSIISAIQIYNSMARYYFNRQKPDSCISYANKAIGLIRSSGMLLDEPETFGVLSDAYKAKRDLDSCFKYVNLMQSVKDSLLGMDKIEEVQSMIFDEQQQRQSELVAELAYKNRVKFISLFAGIALLFGVAALLWRSAQVKQKSYSALKRQQEETEFQRNKAEQTLEKLQDTQSQLIQSEKMASLGELTAGIAHEIQNPLNFINNFSEVNAELFDEMEKEMDSGNLNDVKTIAKDIKENERKITLHGKRADAIVKGMLQHSRTSTGHKEPADINALAGEYLRLCYHGLRAKDGSFNVNMHTEFDSTVGKVNMVAQDIGRVLLNLYGNAFYTVSEKKKQHPEGYEPTVSVCTKRVGAKVELRVKDNGNGIPDKVHDKIFQPFFTTKPAGQGTGLGLSLSYDIIKAHGGELKVNSHEGEGAEFIIVIPIT